MPQADVGSYLRVTVTYTDPEGSGKSAMARSDYKVQAVRAATTPLCSPTTLTWTDEIEALRQLRRGGGEHGSGPGHRRPVVAEDEDGDVLTYTLSGTDADSFDIDWATGQLMTKVALDEETVIQLHRDGEPRTRTGVPQAETL